MSLQPSVTPSTIASASATPEQTPPPRAWSVVASFGSADSTTSVNDVIAGGPGYVAVGVIWQATYVPRLSPGEVPHHGEVWTSVDGRSWSPIADPSAFVDGIVEHVIATPGGLVAYGRYLTATSSAERRWTSVDGLTWSEARDPGLGSADNPYIIDDVIPGGPGFIAVGGGCCQYGSGSARIWTSRDGLAWSVAFDLPGGPWLNAIASRSDGYVAVGDGGGHPLAVVSPDAVTWTSVDIQLSPPTATADAVAWIDARFIATGDLARGGLPVWESADGRTWQPIASPPSQPDTEWFGLGAALSVAGGRAYLSASFNQSGAPAGIWTSSDGLAWTQLVTAAIPSDATMGRVIEMADGGLLMIGRRGATDAQGTIWLLDGQ